MAIWTIIQWSYIKTYKIRYVILNLNSVITSSSITMRFVLMIFFF